MILMASTEVDSTGASYYGKQTLYFMNTKGDSMSVPLNKDGPIHAVEWNPKGNEFCVIYGYMPAKATFFNLKGDAVFEIKEGARNSIYFNPFGNIVLLAGFGNLRGSVEVWDANAKKLITTFQAPDSTLVSCYFYNYCLKNHKHVTLNTVVSTSNSWNGVLMVKNC